VSGLQCPLVNPVDVSLSHRQSRAQTNTYLPSNLAATQDYPGVIALVVRRYTKRELALVARPGQRIVLTPFINPVHGARDVLPEEPAEHDLTAVTV
jgi:hypothetical protein